MASRNGQDAKRVGAVLVVGGGIGGMQASLDLAESGLKVYMVEAADSIGGKMAMLDKTFPTNDCAMCTISPKLVECGRHLNIEIITGATVEKLDGDAVRAHLRFSVEDTGIGIAPDKLASVFEKFTQADGSITRRYGGTGLGLAIAKHIVLAHGGTIRAESELNHGSTFLFALPAGQKRDEQ